MSIFVSVGKLIKNGVVDGYSITFFTELDFQGTCPLNAHVECRASLALISYIGEVVCLRNGSRADLGHPIWATRSGRAVLADPIWATHYGRPVLADPIWATRSGRSVLGEPFWPTRSRSGYGSGSGRPDLAEPSWETSIRRSIHALGLRNHIFQPMKIFGSVADLIKRGRGWLFGHIFHRFGLLRYLSLWSQTSNT